MNSDKKKLPKITFQSNIEDIAVNRVEAKFINNGHRLQRISPDVGTDLRVVYNDDGCARGFSTAIQVKGTKSKDTDSYLAFMQKVSVHNLLYLNESPEPAYYIVHNCDLDKSYYREAHEILVEYDQCRPGWREKDEIGVLIYSENVLTDEVINTWMLESEAWANERKTTKDIVEILEAAVAKYCKVTTNHKKPSGSDFYSSVIASIVYASRLLDILDVLEFYHHLAFCSLLCSLYRHRARNLILPISITATSNLGPLKLYELTQLLSSAQQDYLLFEKELNGRLSSTDRKDSRSISAKPRNLAGLTMLAEDIEDKSKLIEGLLSRFHGLGIKGEFVSPEDKYIRVSAENATGLLLISTFLSDFGLSEIRDFNKLAKDSGTDAAAIIIHPSQIMDWGATKSKSPKKTVSLEIPLGTACPVVEKFEKALLVKAIKKRKNVDNSIQATEYRSCFCHSLHQEFDIGSPATVFFQQEFCRRYCDKVWQILKAGKHASFVFSYLDQNSYEIHTFMNSTELLAYLCGGPISFQNIGGSVSILIRDKME
ncbi:DUF4365 domain-containing protein [bacterium]|nr:DUF4365 domain-containing protein [bacterium]